MSKQLKAIAKAIATKSSFSFNGYDFAHKFGCNWIATSETDSFVFAINSGANVHQVLEQIASIAE